ncbi:MAG TPA: NrfD/PsrC family molybdoenzyme membrane anchor subunit, partial [Gemmataceae bacterium]|nr:NrfD/PsrC family molybdoenzyme membrane anchor subunit [Gemmataceae bacterium]
MARPVPGAPETVENRPVPLKPPVWTWEVPAYFFAGGAAGAAAVIAGVAAAAGADPALVQDARWVAAAGALVSPPLLIADLGRPRRFLNMLRVFKRQSAMSVGVWTLVVFSMAAVVAAGLHAVPGELMRTTPAILLASLADSVAALAGLVLTTYTGVLIGATVIPVWKAHVRLLPFHFAASSLGAA